MNSVSIKDPKNLEKKINKFKTDGVTSFHIVADFDRTLTKAFVNGKTHTFYELIRAGNYLSPEYVKKAYALYDKYRPIEISGTISREEKCKKMVEWWSRHWKLMIESGMNLDVIKDIISKNKVQIREGALELFDVLAENKIPILIFSASIGNFIEEYLRSVGKLTKNVHIISNFFKFDKCGKAIGYTEPFIHILNKDETHVKEHVYQNEITKRRNVILLGDQLEDLDMIKGIKHECIIRIGFLNADVENLIDKYNNCFDAIILNDGPMDYVNSLIKEII
jgi:5'-nucleotidase